MVFLGLCCQVVEPRLYLLSFYVFSIHSSNTSTRSENMSVRMQRLKNKYVDFNMWLLFLLSWCPAFGLNFNQKALHPRPAERFSITPKLLIREPKGEMVGVQGPSGYFLFQSPQRPCKAGSLLAAQKETSVMQIWVCLQSSRARAEAGIRTRVEEVLESLAISRSRICHPQNRPLWDIDYFELCCCCSVAKSCSILGLGRSPGEGNGCSLQHSCLGNPLDRGAWRATVHGVPNRVRHDLVTKQQQRNEINTHKCLNAAYQWSSDQVR